MFLCGTRCCRAKDCEKLQQIEITTYKIGKCRTITVYLIKKICELRDQNGVPYFKNVLSVLEISICNNISKIRINTDILKQLLQSKSLT